MLSSQQGKPRQIPPKPHFFLIPPDRIGLTVPFDDLKARHFRAIPGHRWESGMQCWSFPRTREALDQLLAAYRTDWRILDSDVAEAFGFTKSAKPDPRRSSNPRLDSSRDLELIQRELRIRNYSPRTIKTYGSCVRTFAEYFATKRLRDLSNEEIRGYILHQIEVKKLSAGSISQILSALRFVYEEVYKSPIVLGDIERPRKARQLPVVLSLEEVKALLESSGNLKHRVLLMIAYSAGLRVSEIVHLKLEDIDSQRKLIHVHSGKGQKDRYTILSDVVLDGLRDYWKAYKPQSWLFEGQRAGESYSVRSAQKVFENAAEKAGIRKHVSIHSLRHSFATHLLEQGTDIRFIQALLGHSSVKTTEIYTHVSRRQIGMLHSPIDQILQPREK